MKVIGLIQAIFYYVGGLLVKILLLTVTLLTHFEFP
jgi:hypothetical protein